MCVTECAVLQVCLCVFTSYVRACVCVCVCMRALAHVNVYVVRVCVCVCGLRVCMGVLMFVCL